MRGILLACVVVGLLLSTLPARSLTLSGGIDLRAPARDEDAEVAAFLNLRHVIAQGAADRWILVAQADSGDNFESPYLYQTYAQLKGPLGRWNVRAGRFIVPFGLLGGYDSERHVLNTIEPLSLGVKLDAGLEVHGFAGDYDYALAVTEGAGFDGALVSGRFGRRTDAWDVGLSALIGRLPETASKESVERRGRLLHDVRQVDKRRLGVDATWTDGPNLWRGEALIGTDDGAFVAGGYLEYERALRAGWTLGWNAGLWDGAATRWRVGAVVSRALGRAGLLRAAYVHEDETEGRAHTVVVQYYWEFAHAL